LSVLTLTGTRSGRPALARRANPLRDLEARSKCNRPDAQGGHSDRPVHTELREWGGRVVLLPVAPGGEEV